MNGALFGAMVKSQARSWASYGFGMVIYLWLFIGIYPSFAGSQALNKLLQTLPAGLLRVLGYTAGATHLSTFLGGEFYSLLYLIIMAIFVMFAATKLMAHLIDNGSMAYLLATPVSRVKVAVTQAAVLLSGVWAIALASTVGGLIGAHWFVHHSGIATGAFVRMNAVGALLFSVVAGYAFVMSCLARDERSALGFSALFTLLFYVLHTVADLTPHFAWLNHLSLFTAFNPQNLMQGHGQFALDAVGLAAAAVVLFGIAVAGFARRQLTL
jgi:ABC-2 type transport system permease protein